MVFSRPYNLPAHLLILALVICASAGHARVATPPTSADRRLINPAAAALRDYFGFAIDASRQEDQEDVLGLSKASIEIKTKIESVNTNAAFRTGNFFWELSVSPERGDKDTTSFSQTDSGPNNNSSSSQLSITPIQAIAAMKFGTSLSFGIKLMHTQYGFQDATKLSINTPIENQEVEENRQLSGTFLVGAPGFIYQLGNSGLSLAYLAEFFQVQSNQAVQGTNVRSAFSGVGVSETTSIDTKSEDTIFARKDIVGLGYLKKFSGGNSIRFEASYEKMPPLTKVQGYPYGEMYRAIGELNLFYFRIGAETTRKTGYYIDPYNLIPYFFKIDHLGVEPVQETSLFGGLKTSSGHGFGASYSQSTSTSLQRLSVGSSEQNVEKKTKRVGISYSYTF